MSFHLTEYGYRYFFLGWRQGPGKEETCKWYLFYPHFQWNFQFKNEEKEMCGILWALGLSFKSNIVKIRAVCVHSLCWDTKFLSTWANNPLPYIPLLSLSQTLPACGCRFTRAGHSCICRTIPEIHLRDFWLGHSPLFPVEPPKALFLCYFREQFASSATSAVQPEQRAARPRRDPHARQSPEMKAISPKVCANP